MNILWQCEYFIVKLAAQRVIIHVIIINNFNSILYQLKKYEILFSFTILCEPSPDDKKNVT
jgi:hypothetical protein